MLIEACFDSGRSSPYQEVILVDSRLHIEVKNLKMLVLNNLLSEFWAFQLQEIFDNSQLTQNKVSLTSKTLVTKQILYTHRVHGVIIGH